MLTDREFGLIAETQGTVTITPSTDMPMQFGTFPATGPALSRGIVCGFGIDTICSAGNDLFAEMRLALAAERSRANALVGSQHRPGQHGPLTGTHVILSNGAGDTDRQHREA
jgi:5-methylthioadenosine/S-adenosylhomocysteine deaminase